MVLLQKSNQNQKGAEDQKKPWQMVLEFHFVLRYVHDLNR